MIEHPTLTRNTNVNSLMQTSAYHISFGAQFRNYIYALIDMTEQTLGLNIPWMDFHHRHPFKSIISAYLKKFNPFAVTFRNVFNS